MARHEFGIMEHRPVAGERFDKYEPQKYNCISVDDDYISPLLERLAQAQFYWHTVDIAGSGLAYCGITLLSPEMAGTMLGLIKNEPGLDELAILLNKAVKEQRFIIHFGI